MLEVRPKDYDLLDWRRKHGCTQPDMARHLGVELRTYQRWEQSRSPKYYLLIGFALQALDAALKSPDAKLVPERQHRPRSIREQMGSEFHFGRRWNDGAWLPERNKDAIDMLKAAAPGTLYYVSQRDGRWKQFVRGPNGWNNDRSTGIYNDTWEKFDA